MYVCDGGPPGMPGLWRLCLRCCLLGALDGDGVLPTRELELWLIDPNEWYAPEAVLEATRDGLEVPHATGTSGLSALGLLAPLVRPQLSTGVAALSALWTS